MRWVFENKVIPGERHKCSHSASTERETQRAQHAGPGTEPTPRQRWPLPRTRTRLPPRSAAAPGHPFPAGSAPGPGCSHTKSCRNRFSQAAPTSQPCPTTAAITDPTSAPRDEATILLEATSPAATTGASLGGWRRFLSTGNWWQLMHHPHLGTLIKPAAAVPCPRALLQPGSRSTWVMAAPRCSAEGPQCVELIKLIGILLSGCSAAAWSPRQQECLCECRLKHTQCYVLLMLHILTPN